MYNRVRQAVSWVRESDSRKRLLENIFSLSVLQLMNYILPLLTLPYLLLTLDVKDYGAIIFAHAVTSFLCIFASYGFGLYGAREIAIYRDSPYEVSRIFSTIMAITIVLIIIMYLVMNIIVFFISALRADWFLYQMTFLWVVVGNCLFPIWFFQGMENMKYITVLSVIAKVTFTLMVFVVVKDHHDYIYVPALYAIGFILASVISLFVILRKFKVKIVMPLLKDIKRYLFEATPLFFSHLSTNIWTVSNPLILGVVADYSAVTYFSVPERIMRAVQKVTIPLAQALFPHYSRKLQNVSVADGFEDIKKIAKYFMPFCLLLTLFLFILAPLLQKYFFSQSQNFTVNLWIMSPIILLGSITYLCGVLGLVNFRQDKHYMRCLLITGVFDVLIIAILGYWYDDIGASTGILLSELLLASLIYLKLKRLVRDSVR